MELGTVEGGWQSRHVQPDSAGSAANKAVNGDVARQEPPGHARAVGQSRKIEGSAEAPARA
jgi:hypothetical protein